MKRIVLLLLLATLSISMRSQTVTIPSSIDDVNLYQYVGGDSIGITPKISKNFTNVFLSAGIMFKMKKGIGFLFIPGFRVLTT